MEIINKAKMENLNVETSKSFTDLLVWQKAHKLTLFIYQLTKNFPKDEVFTLTSQFRRAAISISANIAEGFKRIGKQDKLRFYNIAQGSLEECKYFSILAKDLKYISEDEFASLSNSYNEVSYLLSSYCGAITKRMN